MGFSKEFFQGVRNDILEDCKRYAYMSPRLVIISVGDDPASKVYVNNKIKTCEAVGVDYIVHNLPESIKYSDLRDLIKSLDENVNNNGIILQLPLPKHLQMHQQLLLDCISWEKDVDGLSTESIGRLWTGKECHKPATAEGVMRIIDKKYGYYNTIGMKIAIINRSSLIGRPLIKMLLDANAQVTVYHSLCQDIQEAFDNNDLVISATGCDISRYFNNQCDWIDCGIIRENGKVHGDAGELKSPRITPVPGGVGTLTTACLIENTVVSKMKWG